MLNQILIFLPVVMCVFIMMINAMMANKTRAFIISEYLFVIAAIYFYTDCCYSSTAVNLYTLVITSIVAQFITPCLMPTAMHYLYKLNDRRRIHNGSPLWLMLPVALICVELALMASMGWSESIEFIKDYYEGDITIAMMTKSQYILYFCMQNIFRLILLVEIVVFFAWSISTAHREGFSFEDLRMFFKGEPIDPVQVQYFNITNLVIILFAKMFFPREYLIDHQLVAAIFGFLLTFAAFLTGFMGLFIARGHISISDISNLTKKSNLMEHPQQIVNEAIAQEAAETDAEQPAQIETNSEEAPIPMPEEEDPGEEEEYYETPKEKPIFFDEDLKARFETLMIDEQLFLTQGITLSEVATKLHSNKTYISKLVNTNYNSTFPDYLNTLRIDYAEQYLLHHRDARQADIAKACGFPSASAFNNTFKKLTGQTPKIWLATKK